MIFYKNLILFYKNTRILKILIPFKFKYSNIKFKNDFNKFIFFKSINKFNEFFNTKNYFFVEKNFILDNIIDFKNSYSFFKKLDNIKNIFINSEENNKDFFKKLDFKNYDFSEKKLVFYRSNRELLKFFFKKQHKKKLFLNKFFKKISKTKNTDYINFFEFSLDNVLINSNFFLNSNDVNYFIKNGFLNINNKKLIEKTCFLKNNDKISIIFSKYYYIFYRNYFNKFEDNNYKINFYNNKNEDNNYKNGLNFIKKHIFFKKDVPFYLEVDYINMTIFIINTNTYILNSYQIKILNFFSRRLNNWKYII